MYSLMSKRRNWHAERLGELLGELRLADARRAREQERADRAVRAAEARARALHRAHDRRDRLVLAEDDPAQVALEALEPLAVRGRGASRSGMRAIRATQRLDVAHADGLALLDALRSRTAAPASSITSIALSGRKRSMQVLGRELHAGAQRRRGVVHAVVLLVARREALEDLHRVVDRRLVHVDPLEAARERAVALEVAVLLEGGRAHAAQLAGLQQRLQQVRRVDRARPARRPRRAWCGSRR